MPTFPDPPDLTQTTIFIYVIGIAIAIASFLSGIKDPPQAPKNFAIGFTALVITYFIARAANKSEYSPNLKIFLPASLWPLHSPPTLSSYKQNQPWNN